MHDNSKEAYGPIWIRIPVRKPILSRMGEAVKKESTLGGASAHDRKHGICL